MSIYLLDCNYSTEPVSPGALVEEDRGGTECSHLESSPLPPSTFLLFRAPVLHTSIGRQRGFRCGSGPELYRAVRWCLKCSVTERNRVTANQVSGVAWLRFRAELQREDQSMKGKMFWAMTEQTVGPVALSLASGSPQIWARMLGRTSRSFRDFIFNGKAAGVQLMLCGCSKSFCV